MAQVLRDILPNFRNKFMRCHMALSQRSHDVSVFDSNSEIIINFGSNFSGQI